MESNGVVFIEVERASTKALEPDYNVGNFRDPKTLVSGIKNDTNPCPVARR